MICSALRRCFGEHYSDQLRVTQHHHIPVMLREVLATLQPKDGGVYVDGTFGAGGYTRAILESADCTVYGIDRDPDAFLRAQKLQKEFPDRFTPLHGCFGSVSELLASVGVTKIDGLVLDLGVSSIQLAERERGFSFQHDGPLDMRMSCEGLSAADIVNTYDEKEIADILYHYGDEKASRKIAKKIVSARADREITTTLGLARIIHDVLPMHGGMKTDTATRSFQALRIHVNDELGELDRALAAAEELLIPGGRLVVVSFHSLEDGRVKNYLKEKSGASDQGSRHLPPVAVNFVAPLYTLEKKQGLKPQDDEVSSNPRARSAHLRWAIRTEVPAHA